MLDPPVVVNVSDKVLCCSLATGKSRLESLVLKIRLRRVCGERDGQCIGCVADDGKISLADPLDCGKGDAQRRALTCARNGRQAQTLAAIAVPEAVALLMLTAAVPEL